MKSRGGTTARNRVRIIGGAWRGTRLAIARDALVRPTPDRVRETLFNWLQPAIAGARCLDLYAGTGVLGLEALSRGAAQVWFIERDRRLAGVLEAQLRRLGGSGHVVSADALRWLDVQDGHEAGVAGAPAAATAFDVVFVDPPYSMPLAPILRLLPRWLSTGALVYVERPLRQGLPAPPPEARWFRQARAGTVGYGLLEYAPVPE